MPSKPPSSSSRPISARARWANSAKPASLAAALVGDEKGRCAVHKGCCYRLNRQPLERKVILLTVFRPRSGDGIKPGADANIAP